MALRLKQNVDYFETQEDKTKYALDFIDKLIVDLPEYGNFHITNYIKHSEQDEKKKIKSLSSYIETIMLEVGLIEVPYHANAMYKVTELGRKVKSEGGYYKYLENMKEKDQSKAENIITNNLYGSNNSLNNAVGSNITIISTNKVTLSEAQINELKEIGVEEPEIEALNNIVSEDNKDSSEFSKKLFAWVSSVTASMVSRGIYDHIPQVSNFVNQLI